GAGEVQDDQVVILGGGAHGGGHVGADEVHGAGLQLHDHVGRGLGGSLDISALDLGQAGVIPDGAGLGGALAGQLLDGGGAGVGGVLGGDADDGGVEVGARHVHRGHAVGGHGLAGDVGVH